MKDLLYHEPLRIPKRRQDLSFARHSYYTVGFIALFARTFNDALLGFTMFLEIIYTIET